jgi:LysR family glycine cleavage system transcriptional activator
MVVIHQVERQAIHSLPPLKPLRAFVLVAQTKSFTTAGDRIYLSQSAVSSQIKQLEDYLGVRLFERKPNRLHLTEAGKRYAEPVMQALDMLSKATADIIEAQKYVELKLQVLPIFASWLTPRLDQFKRQYPRIKIHFQGLGDALFLSDSVDMAIIPQHRPQNGSDQIVQDFFDLALVDENGCRGSDWCLVYLQKRSSEDAIKAFREWLLKEVA